ncbi:P-loop containing nucleoside triphosphate hydrolases superfamily protein isoform 1 [Hibiscus syriacus]|uniref:P-loop containing nucleoside triphosphate hydrolases superfamily protein isoform 1 n=1 Tax=Hibiscus syriacus TaxID=106335 RepID=A0A6A3AHN6_HIBSY|nr:P-loop containing nucleoside triphosphate hydrolases superfamily protein isoform 1 [Hibiscus syriacus]
MGDSNYQAAKTSRLGLKHGGGEMGEVEGGRIDRSTGRKDGHSKVCTAKAKSAIDELAELPPWNPETLKTATSPTKLPNNQEDQNSITAIDHEKPCQFHNLAAGSGTRRRTATIMGNEVQILQEIGDYPDRNSGFLPHSLVSDEIEDTLKSFIPSGASSETPSSSLQFQDYSPDFSTRTGSHSQDLRLSLQSFPKPMLLLHHHQAAAAAAQAHQSEPVLFSGFNGSSAGWEHHNQHLAEIGKSQRLVAWNNGGAGSGTGGGSSGGSGGFLFGNPSAPPLPPAFGQNSQFISQRGPLQSSNTPLVVAWNNVVLVVALAVVLVAEWWIPLWKSIGTATATCFWTKQPVYFSEGTPSVQ